MKVDLHCHSYYSDGKHAPDFLIQRAIQNQVTHLAITDHDCTEALVEVANTGSELILINGVEISCAWEAIEVHVVGLLFDPQDEDMRGLLASQQEKRRARMLAIDTKLQAMGNEGLMSYLQALPCISYTRSHVADFLVDRGICKSRQKAFKSFLGKGGRLYEAANWCPLQDAVSVINNSGGIAVLAHPGRYPLGKKKLEALADDFANHGGEAIEVSYSNIQQRTMLQLSELCLSKNLYASVGSDFHDAAAHWMDIGRIPLLDQQTKNNAIWLHPRWHSLNK